MPLYDFRCRACGHVFEVLVRHEPPAACEKCQAADLERLPSVFAATSSDRRSEIAAKQVSKNASVGRQEFMAEQREIEHHRNEDH